MVLRNFAKTGSHRIVNLLVKSRKAEFYCTLFAIFSSRGIETIGVGSSSPIKKAMPHLISVITLKKEIGDVRLLTPFFVLPRYIHTINGLWKSLESWWHHEVQLASLIMLKGNTNWNLYKTFVAVYEHKSMCKASKTLGITPTAVGQNMKELGRQLGITLFTAHGKGVKPTSDAIDIYPTIKDATESILRAESRVSKLREKKKTTIKIAILSVSAKILIQDYLKEFYAKHQGIELGISGLDAIDLASQKQQDLVIATTHRVHQGLKAIKLYTTETALFATKDFLKERGLSNTMSKEQLLELPIVISKGDTSKDFLKQMDSKKVTLSIQSVTSSDVIYAITKNSTCVGCMGTVTMNLLNGANDTSLVQLHVTGITYPAATQIICAYNESLSKPARAFVDGFKKFCQERLSQN